MTRISAFTDRFSTLAGGYDAVLSDVWGVIHNGVAATPAACEALTRFRAQGGTVILITNAPRPGAVVTKFLDKLNVPRTAYDGIVSSGDVTRAVMSARPGKNVFHIGPERDLPIFDGLGLTFVPLERADYVVCTGLRDDTVETAEDYRAEMEMVRKRNMLLVCGNPDIVVERGHELVYCAGAIADLYRDMGGEVIYCGKPYRPIYDEAMARVVTARGKTPERNRIIAIGDSVRTDLTGAAEYGLDCLFVTAGIHAADLGHRDAPDLSALNRMFADAGIAPKAVMSSLAW